MSAFYDRAADTAVRLLTKFGVPRTFTRTTAAVTNPVTGAVITPGTTTTHSPMGVIVPVKANLIDGTRIVAGDQVLIIDGTFEPLMSDTFAGWNIKEIEYKRPADKLIVSFVRIRK